MDSSPYGLLMFLSGLIFLSGMIPYYLGMKGWRVEKPYVAPVLSFSIWLGTDVVQVAAGIGSGTSVLIPTFAGIGSIVILRLAFKLRTCTLVWDGFNTWTVVLAAAAIVAWVVILTIEQLNIYPDLGANVSLLLGLAAGAVGVFPVWRDLWHDRFSHGVVMWVLWVISPMVGVVATILKVDVRPIDFAIPGLYFLLSCGTLLLIFTPWRPSRTT